MNYNISTYIGQTVRRLIVYIEHSVTHNRKLICSVIEKLEDDMFDFNEDLCHRESGVDLSSGYKACLAFDKVVLTADMIERPHECFELDGAKIEFIAQRMIMEPSIRQTMLVNMDSLNSYEFNAVLPKRNCTAFMNCLIDSNRSVQTFLEGNKSLVNKISEVTAGLSELGLDVSPQHWGNLYYVTYNPIFRNVEIMLSSTPCGILLRFDYRNTGVYRPMKVVVTDFHHGDIPVGESSQIVESGSRYVLVKTPSIPNCVNVRIVDEDGSMLFFRKDMHFIRNIQINTGIQSAKFVIENNGEKIELPKYDYETRKRSEDAVSFENYFKMRAKDVSDHPLSSKLYNMSIGTEEKTKNNVQNFIISILNQATKECYICDPYFGFEEFIQTVARMDNVTTRVNILTSETYLKVEDIERLSQILNDYNKLNRYGGNVLCRLTKKRKTLHERLIIIDDRGWVYNKSLNEKSKSSLLFSEIPTSEFKQYKKIVEKAWFDGDSTIKLEDYGNN